jgi:hypothetical protein
MRSLSMTPIFATLLCVLLFMPLADPASAVVSDPAANRLAVGPEWTHFSTEQQNALIAAFSRFTIANYRSQFSRF